MPKKEINDYVIYKIICNDENIKDCYVGSTSNFKVRKWDHKRLSNDENSKFKIYETIRNNGGWTNWTMLPIEEHKEITVIQARIKEEEQRVLLNASMNSRAAFRTAEEARQLDLKQRKKYRQTEEAKVKEQKYRELNKDKKYEQQRQWWALNVDEEYKQKRNEKLREQRRLNKEEYNAKQREWRLRRLNKKDEIK